MQGEGRAPEHLKCGCAQGWQELLLLGRALSWLCVSHQLTEGKMMERRKKIALELSELVVYCRPVPFDEESKAGPGVVCMCPEGWWYESGV